MSGSNGGMRITKKEALFYHKHGIPALALALFRTCQTPKNLSGVPVEYVENAIRWLKKQGYEKIGVDGMSKGSEMALVAASMFPDISCVVARVPSYFVSEGLAGSGKSKAPSGTSCWSYKGKDLPYAPYRSRTFNLMEMVRKEKELHIISFNKDKEVRPEDIIPVERIKAPILLLSSKHDAVWPSYESALLIEKRLKDNAFHYPVRHIAFDHMSHAALTDISWIYRLAFKAERQDPSGCAADRRKMRRELLHWVNKAWK